MKVIMLTVIIVNKPPNNRLKLTARGRSVAESRSRSRTAA
jgi:hypothetical protein